MPLEKTKTKQNYFWPVLSVLWPENSFLPFSYTEWTTFFLKNEKVHCFNIQCIVEASSLNHNMTLESKENYPQHTKIVQNSLGFMQGEKTNLKPCGDLLLWTLYWSIGFSCTLDEWVHNINLKILIKTNQHMGCKFHSISSAAQKCQKHIKKIFWILIQKVIDLLCTFQGHLPSFSTLDETATTNNGWTSAWGKSGVASWFSPLLGFFKKQFIKKHVKENIAPHLGSWWLSSFSWFQWLPSPISCICLLRATDLCPIPSNDVSQCR